MGSPSGLAPEFPGSQPGVLLLDDDEHTNKKEAPTESARLPYGNNLAVNYVRISALTKNKLDWESLCCMANQTGLDSQPSSGCCKDEPRDPAGLKLRLSCELEYVMVGNSPQKMAHAKIGRGALVSLETHGTAMQCGL